MTQPPLLALDVDGPLAIFGTHPPGDTLELRVAGVPLTISRQLSARLHRLLPHYQIVWSTSWGREASLKLAPLLGLPPGLPFLDFARFRAARQGESRKLPAFKSWLKNRSVAIVDDEIGHDIIAWANARPAPTLLVEVDPRHGLQDTHVEDLLRFASAIPAKWDDPLER